MNRRVAWILGPLTLFTVSELFFLYHRLMSLDLPGNNKSGRKMSDAVHVREDTSDFVDKIGVTYQIADASEQETTMVQISPNPAMGKYLDRINSPGFESTLMATPDDKHSATTDESTSDSLKAMGSTRRYLFPVQFWEGGPNWNYLSFRRLVAYAITHNRTIVMIPFHNHFIEGWAMGWRSFEETLDVDKLRKIVPLVTPQTYKEDCGNAVEFLVQFPLSRMKKSFRRFHRSQYERTRTDFEDLWGIELPDTSHISRTLAETALQVKKADDVRCLAIHGPLKIDDLMIANEPDVLKVVDRVFLRAEYIRRMGNRVKSKMCGGKPYIAIHWRNRTGEACEFNLVLNGAERCAGDLLTLSNASQSIAEAVGVLAKDLGIDCVYIAAPPRRQAFVDSLRNTVPNVATAFDITAMTDKKLRRLRKDNYKLSLVEQEVCAGAELFLSCGRSNWSDFVRIGRELVGRKVLYLRDLLGVPKEIYQLI
ncbi:uncharacterized protein [Ptychodera flava]|uniref:uncharacterized protein n=1 Tax=Ptychodera flava TaxID=63121 RepID=UPI003969EAAA